MLSSVFSLFALHYNLVLFFILIDAFACFSILIIVFILQQQILIYHQCLFIIFQYSIYNFSLFLISIVTSIQCFINYASDISNSVILLLNFIRNIFQIIFNKYLFKFFPFIHCHLSFGNSQQLVYCLLLFPLFLVQFIFFLQRLVLLIYLFDFLLMLFF